MEYILRPIFRFICHPELSYFGVSDVVPSYEEISYFSEVESKRELPKISLSRRMIWAWTNLALNILSIFWTVIWMILLWSYSYKFSDEKTDTWITTSDVITTIVYIVVIYIVLNILAIVICGCSGIGYANGVGYLVYLLEKIFSWIVPIGACFLLTIVFLFPVVFSFCSMKDVPGLCQLMQGHPEGSEQGYVALIFWVATCPFLALYCCNCFFLYRSLRGYYPYSIQGSDLRRNLITSGLYQRRHDLELGVRQSLEEDIRAKERLDNLPVYDYEKERTRKAESWYDMKVREAKIRSGGLAISY